MHAFKHEFWALCLIWSHQKLWKGRYIPNFLILCIAVSLNQLFMELLGPMRIGSEPILRPLVMEIGQILYIPIC